VAGRFKNLTDDLITIRAKIQVNEPLTLEEQRAWNTYVVEKQEWLEQSRLSKMSRRSREALWRKLQTEESLTYYEKKTLGLSLEGETPYVDLFKGLGFLGTIRLMLVMLSLLVLVFWVLDGCLDFVRHGLSGSYTESPDMDAE